MDWIYLFNEFHGRISRQTFWMAVVVLVIVETVGHLIVGVFQNDRLGAIIDLAFIYPEFAVAIKRAHDRNLPLWLLGIFFGASAVLDFFAVLDILAVPDLAGTDEAPNMLSLAIAVPFTVLLIALLVELGFRRGTVGPNQYGPDPLAKV
jgi:uncharacterized membrane protein YhaH (DUF805 family)